MREQRISPQTVRRWAYIERFSTPPDPEMADGLSQLADQLERDVPVIVAASQCSHVPGSKGENAMSDKELLDRLEAEIKNDPIVLWEGTGEYPGRPLRGLSLLGGKRTLRTALEYLNPSPPNAGGKER